MLLRMNAFLWKKINKTLRKTILVTKDGFSLRLISISAENISRVE